jgi:hypothetical protein
MSRETRLILTAVVVIVGICAMVGGIIADKHGATVIGIIVASVATRQFIATRKKSIRQDR